MPQYSKSSESKLDTASQLLQKLFRIVIQHYDNTIIQGHRPVAEQLEYYNSGRSRVKFGKHNVSPSEAVDSAPYIPGRGIPWPDNNVDWTDKNQRDKYIKDLCQFYHYGGFVEGIAAVMPDVNIRWGGDWDRDNDIADQSFNDLVHFEIHK